MRGQDRAKYGAIVAFENEDGKVVSIHRTGPVRQAVREACAIAMSWDESFRVTAVSTPGSIWSDLQGRMPVVRGDGYPEFQFPERIIVSVGFGAILHPKLLGQNRSSVQNRRSKQRPPMCGRSGD